jgi:hypothetical protein
MLFSYSSIFPIAQSTRIKKDGDVGISNYHSAIQDLESIGRVWKLQLYLYWNL